MNISYVNFRYQWHQDLMYELAVLRQEVSEMRAGFAAAKARNRELEGNLARREEEVRQTRTAEPNGRG
jgi:hypothetical protein